MAELVNKRVVLGVTGGIAAYKSAELLRKLKVAGAEVRVVMTSAATQFITPLTMQALSGQTVHLDLMDAATENAMGHIELARWADVIVVAPATANFMAKLAHGFADDLLSTMCLASAAPLLIAPAMNQAMWGQAVTQSNYRLLQERGVQILGPTMGDQACGEIGLGRLVDPVGIVSAVSKIFASGSLQGTKIIITAGPTREPIDPVRFISNRSTGKMGYALAQAAIDAGAKVMLISGPVTLPCPHHCDRILVERAVDMYEAVLMHLTDCDIFISVAAVSDYTVAASAAQKIKKGDAGLDLCLVQTPDILSAVAASPNPPFLVGFAAETEALEVNARSKLVSKGLDIVAANWVGRADQGFDSNDNALIVVWQGGRKELVLSSKTSIARQLFEIIAEQYYAKRSA